jgi:hypothetical protein
MTEIKSSRRPFWAMRIDLTSVVRFRIQPGPPLNNELPEQ